MRPRRLLRQLAQISKRIAEVKLETRQLAMVKFAKGGGQDRGGTVMSFLKSKMACRMPTDERLDV